MKKILSIVMSLVFVLALSMTAFAVEKGATHYAFDSINELAGFGVDRYAPAGFDITTFGTKNVLKQSIAAGDSLNNRPDNYKSTFYNTQGKKLATPGAQEVSIKLYIPSDWKTAGKRMAGFWGVGFDADKQIALYPIVEFMSDSDNPRFRVWTNGDWVDIGLPKNFKYNAWYKLSMKLLNNGVFISVGDVSYLAPFEGTPVVELGEIILQGHNTDIGVNYDIYWDDLMIK